MNPTPNSSRLTVCIFGKSNAGKSSLFNAITGTDTAIVSDIPGTTADPVAKAMELLPHGPIVLIDTAGTQDYSNLGSARVKKTQSMLNRADFAIYAMDSRDMDMQDYESFKSVFTHKNIPYITVLTKADLNMPEKDTENFINISIYNKKSIDLLKKILSDEIGRAHV